jgi:hypothetical protein
MFSPRERLRANRAREGVTRGARMGGKVVERSRVQSGQREEVSGDRG